jgi:uncharacterized Zn-binding protein involved in type VI secretion
MSGLPAARKGDPTGHSTSDADAVETGSPDVLIAGLAAARAGVDAGVCPIHRERSVKTGSATVWINKKPAARATDKLTCSGGLVLEGCETVLFGGGAMSGGSRDACTCDGGERSARAGEAVSRGSLLRFVRLALGVAEAAVRVAEGAPAAKERAGASKKPAQHAASGAARQGAAVGGKGNHGARAAGLGAELGRKRGPSGSC